MALTGVDAQNNIKCCLLLESMQFRGRKHSYYGRMHARSDLILWCVWYLLLLSLPYVVSLSLFRVILCYRCSIRYALFYICIYVWYSVNQKVASITFSNILLLVNLCKWKLPWLLPKHNCYYYINFTPILHQLYYTVYLNIMNCMTFTSKTPQILTTQFSSLWNSWIFRLWLPV